MTFTFILKYLRSQRSQLPTNIPLDEFEKLEKAIKYWGLDKGLAHIDTLTEGDQIKQLEQLLQSTPSIDPKKQHTSLKNWKKLQPLKVNEILLHNSPVALDFKRTTIMSHRFPDAMVWGQFLNVSPGSAPQPHGIVRVIAHDHTILEGQYISGRTTGYCRAFHADGSYHIGMVDGSLREGYGRTVTANGSIEEGRWQAGRLAANAANIEADFEAELNDESEEFGGI